VVDAYRTAKNNDAVLLKTYNKWHFYVLFLIVFWGIGACIDSLRTWKSYKMVASSMEPILQNGDRLIADKNAYSGNAQPTRGDVIVFIFPEDKSKDFIKRVIAIPGDNIAIRDRVIIINGKPLVESYVKFTGSNHDIVRKMDNISEITVPKDKYYVVGDNRDKSYDSRFWGFVDRHAIIGKAKFIYYSSDRSRIMLEIN